MARVHVIHEVSTGDELQHAAGWYLCLQWCVYLLDDGGPQYGYRYIWRRPGGALQAARGQARIPSKRIQDYLWRKAEREGWAHLEAEDGGGWEGFDPDADLAEAERPL
jgi:hypothetical protein